MSITDQLEDERRIINAAKEFYSLPLQLQPWGPQNQNGDDCESILMDAYGETVVYGIPDEIGDLAVLASTALPLRNAQVEAGMAVADRWSAEGHSLLLVARGRGDIRTKRRIEDKACLLIKRAEEIRRAIEEAGA